ncbi:hypothetical protein GS896_27505 [Rhodococcus hoagii]|nr:hypothetical protein [Prescottella equi]MBM4570255.1 hypothetical protein [Prescottella equi]MBM4574807.1 hypothetical protein [Prescottella equi]MBM4575111.1 hypothetical protein [Prescottella equi]MBM4653999.1 hypothetical protein [Prescottella equi]
MPLNDAVELDVTRIRQLLTELDAQLVAKGIEAKLFIVGGAAMALAYNARRVTADIDGIFVPRDVVLDAAEAVAAAHRLPKHWLSDGVSQLMPGRDDDHPRSETIGRALTIEIASPQYLLAMKAMSSRQSQGDLDDAALLCKQLGITKESGIEELVGRYFGNSIVGAQELFFERIIDRAATR